MWFIVSSKGTEKSGRHKLSLSGCCFNARIRPSVFPGLAGVAGAIWSFRRQDGDVQDVSTYIVLPLCLSQLCLLSVVLFSNCKDRLL